MVHGPARADAGPVASTKRLRLHGADGFRDAARSRLARCPPRPALRHVGGRGGGLDRRRSRPRPSRSCPDSRTFAPKPCTRRATRWSARSTSLLSRRTRARLFDRAATADGSRRWSAAWSAPELGWDEAEHRAVGMWSQLAASSRSRDRQRAAVPSLGEPHPTAAASTSPTQPSESDPGPASGSPASGRSTPRSSPASAQARPTAPRCLAEASRDWWPLALHWALAGQVGRGRGAVPADRRRPGGRRPAACQRARHPGDRGRRAQRRVRRVSVPVHGGILLDLTAMAGVVESTTTTSLVVEVLPGTFGPDSRRDLRGAWAHARSLAPVDGHLDRRRLARLPRRRASTRPATARSRTWSSASKWPSPTGDVIRTGGAPRAAVGPDLTQLFVGVRGHARRHHPGARLRVHPAPAGRAAGGRRLRRPSTPASTACRRILRRGATPAVLRLYDGPSRRAHTAPTARSPCCSCSTRAIRRSSTRRWPSSPRSAPTARPSTSTLVERLAAPPQRHVRAAGAHPQGVRRRHDGDRGSVGRAARHLRRGHAPPCSPYRTPAPPPAHLSHSYSDGACLYFTFAATPPAEEVESTYVALWDAGTRAVLGAAGNLSHHHGVGLNRGRFVAEALGPAHDVLGAVKAALDPAGILNPGKLGLPSPVRRGAVAVTPTSSTAPGACARARSVAALFAVPFASSPGSLATTTTSRTGLSVLVAGRRCSASCSAPASRRGGRTAGTPLVARRRHGGRRVRRRPDPLRRDPARRRRLAQRGPDHRRASLLVAWPGSSADSSAASSTPTDGPRR